MYKDHILNYLESHRNLAIIRENYQSMKNVLLETAFRAEQTELTRGRMVTLAQNKN